MKKILTAGLIILIIASIFVLTGCEKKEEPIENQTEEIVETTKELSVIDRSNSRMKTDEEVEKQIIESSKKYYEMVYGDNLEDANFSNVMIYKGDEELMEYVDLGIDDYAFEIDYELKLSDENDANQLTTYTGNYDKDTGWVKECHGYGVMRYNEISDDYDVTSITANEF